MPGTRDLSQGWRTLLGVSRKRPGVATPFSEGAGEEAQHVSSRPQGGWLPKVLQGHWALQRRAPEPRARGRASCGVRGPDLAVLGISDPAPCCLLSLAPQNSKAPHPFSVARLHAHQSCLPGSGGPRVGPAACCLGGEKVEGLVDSSVPRGGRGTHTAHTPVSLLAAPCLFSTGCKAQGYGVSERLSCGLG